MSIAQQLRQYLSSLWCLFELVGYHKANPEGRLVFKPLFIERSAAICTFFIWCFAFSINFAVTYTAEGFRQEYIGVMYLVTFLLHLILLVHFMRRNYREKARLIFDLKNFELDRYLGFSWGRNPPETCSCLPATGGNLAWLSLFLGDIIDRGT